MQASANDSMAIPFSHHQLEGNVRAFEAQIRHMNADRLNLKERLTGLVRMRGQAEDLLAHRIEEMNKAEESLAESKAAEENMQVKLGKIEGKIEKLAYSKRKLEEFIQSL